MKTVYIPVTMAARDSLLLPEGACENAHRGIWFYSFDTVGVEVERGDEVKFLVNGDVIATGIVTDLATPDQYPKYCSGLNNKGFIWAETPERSSDEIESQPGIAADCT